MQNSKKHMDFKAVSTGFHLNSLIFGSLWLLYNGVWGLAIVLFAIEAILLNILGKDFAILIQLCISISIFILSEDIKLYWLKLFGYKNINLVYANSEEEAIFKHLEKIHGKPI
ncbi:MAG: DUF2628 domain-containing protein [Rickettsiaceae bacterium]|nr:DUF2628 domain-containing protein [Rickettsiaceae bacterium]